MLRYAEDAGYASSGALELVPRVGVAGLRSATATYSYDYSYSYDTSSSGGGATNDDGATTDDDGWTTVGGVDGGLRCALADGAAPFFSFDGAGDGLEADAPGGRAKVHSPPPPPPTHTHTRETTRRTTRMAQHKTLGSSLTTRYAASHKRTRSYRGACAHQGPRS